jgi:hypothetical protein
MRRVGEQRVQEFGERATTATTQVQERARIVLDEGKDKVSTALHMEQEEADELQEEDAEE